MIYRFGCVLLLIASTLLLTQSKSALAVTLEELLAADERTTQALLETLIIEGKTIEDLRTEYLQRPDLSDGKKKQFLKGKVVRNQLAALEELYNETKRTFNRPPEE